MNLRPSGYEPDELPDCSTPRRADNGSRSLPRPTSWKRRTHRPDVAAWPHAGALRRDRVRCRLGSGQGGPDRRRLRQWAIAGCAATLVRELALCRRRLRWRPCCRDGGPARRGPVARRPAWVLGGDVGAPTAATRSFAPYGIPLSFDRAVRRAIARSARAASTSARSRVSAATALRRRPSDCRSASVASASSTAEIRLRRSAAASSEMVA